MENARGYVAIGVVLLFMGMAVHPAVAQENLKDDLGRADSRDGRELSAPFRELSGLVAELKAAAADPTDSDSDSLPDSVELVIGTDPLNNDTDLDRLNDSWEIELELDPKSMDSNRDGLEDYFEVNGIPLDLDGDGVSNGWDWDNDDDGVVDELDLSAFAKTGLHSAFNISVNSSGKPTYVSLQLRTGNPDHMRLLETSWDWPRDNRSLMQDLDDSVDDITVTPMLEIRTGLDLDPVAVAEYGIFVSGDTAYVPLLPVWDLGNTVALMGKVFIPDLGGPANFSLDLSLKWRVTGQSDHPVQALKAPDGKFVSVNLTGAVRANASTLTDMEGLEFVDVGNGRVALRAFNGMYLRQLPSKRIEATGSELDTGCEFIRESIGGGKIVLKSVYNNHHVFLHADGTLSSSVAAKDATRFELAGPWYRPVPTNLATYPEDFMLTGLSVEENFGSDVGTFYGASVDNLTAANLLLASEFLRNATNGVADMPGRLAGNSIMVQNRTESFLHRDPALLATTGRGLKDIVDALPGHRVLPVINIIEDRSAVVELSDLGGASYIKGNSLLADVGAAKVGTSKALRTGWYDTDNDIQLETPEIVQEIAGWGLPDDSFILMVLLSLSWNTGEHTLTRLGDQEIDFEIVDLDKWTDIAFNVVSNGLGILEDGWGVFEVVSKYTRQLERAREVKEFGVLASNKMHQRVYKELFNQVDNVASGNLKWVNRIGSVLEVLGYVADIGFAIFTLIAMGCATGWGMSGTWSAVLTATLTLAYGLAVGWIAGMLAMCGPAGWVFAGVFLLAVAFSEFFSWLCGGSSWAEALIEKFLGDLTKQIQRSKVALDIADQELTIDDRDGNGLDVGDRLTYDCDFFGNVTAMKYTTPVLNKHWWQMNDLLESYIFPGMLLYDPLFGFVSPGEYSSAGDPSYYIPPNNAYAVKTTRYNTSQFTDLWYPCVNYPFITVLVYAFRYFYEDCFAFLWWWCDRDDYSTLKVEPWNTFYYDVLPGTLDGFASWWCLGSRDVDGDGLNNTEEQGSDQWLWDTDADGLGDRYEAVIGTDPARADTDGDGLDDRLEVQLGTNATRVDSDGDGLQDATEHRGWVVNFDFDGTRFHWHIAPDPRLNDTDGDGLDDYSEYSHLLNPMSGDTNGNGVPDPDDYKDHRLEYGSVFERFQGDVGGSPTFAIETDANGSIYASVDLGSGLRPIVKYHPDGTCDQKLGDHFYVMDIAVGSDGTIYVLNYSVLDYNMHLFRYGSTGSYLGETPTCSTAMTMAIDEANGWIYYTSGEMGVISKHHLSNGTQISSWLPQGVSWGHHNWGKATVDDQGYLYISDPSLDLVFKFDPNGTELARFNASSYGAYQDPVDVGVDSDGYIYVVEKGAHRVQKLDSGGESLVAFGSYGTGNTNLNGPTSVALGPECVYVADGMNYRILNLTSIANYTPPNETFNYTDTDGDGLTDAEEDAGWTVTVENATGNFSYDVTSDPLLYDTDDDGLSDRAERDEGTDPRKADTDGDGESDFEEAGAGGRGLQGRAADGYGWGGRAGLGTNPLNWDTDDDGLGDGTEITFGSDPTSGDTDGDGLLDIDEFDLGANPRSNDTDSDGLDDLAETEFGSGVLTPDADGDYLFDGAEHTLGTDPNSNDTDGDGLIEALEIIYETDPLDPDTDDDGLPDGFEIENLLNASCNDTDGDNVSDAEELERGLNPFNGDSDGDWIPDELDLDYTLVLGDDVVLVTDPDVPLDAFASALASEANVVNASPAELPDRHGTAPYIVIVGSPETENGTAWPLISGLLEENGELRDAMLSGEEHLAVRYGVWSPTQTVVMLTAADGRDALKTLSLLKSMRMTVTQNSIHAEYLNPRACFLQDFMETVLATNASVWTKLTEMATFNVTISGYRTQDAPVALETGNGLEPGEVALGRYLDVTVSENLWGEGVDLILGGQVKLFYTAADLDRTGDGDADDPEDLNESTLALYWYDGAADNWAPLSDTMDWVNGTGLNTSDFSLCGREYAGCIWADVEHLSLFGIAGKIVGGLEVVARAGEDIEVMAGDEVHFDGSLSSGNGAILNFTWTFSLDDRTVALFGPAPSFIFQLPGTYTVTLTVEDSLGLSASDTLTVTVRERPGGKWMLRVGPVTDENGTAIEGALVKLTVGSGTFTNTTDASGFALFELLPEHAPRGAEVVVTKEGYIPAEYSTNITAGRELERNPPPLVRIRPGEEFSLSVGPVKDPSGRPLEGAQVTITVGGQTYTNTTDAQGSAGFVLPLSLLGKDVNVKIDMKGYDAVEYNTRISADRALDQNPPAMEKEGGPAGGGEEGVSPEMIGAVVLLSAILALIVVILARRRPPKKSRPE